MARPKVFAYENSWEPPTFPQSNSWKQTYGPDYDSQLDGKRLGMVIARRRTRGLHRNQAVGCGGSVMPCQGSHSGRVARWQTGTLKRL
jgi:hypothetical protein